MRGVDHQQSQMFSYLSPETRVRKDHPLRAIRSMVDQVLAQLSRRFDRMYASAGRPSIPPEKLLRAQLLQMLYSIRSERLLMEEIDYSVLFRWFVGLNLDEEVWDATTFTKNRDRLLAAEVAKEFLAQVVARAQTKGLTSDEQALHGGWDVAGSLGRGEKFSAEGGKDSASARRSWQPHGELSRGDAIQSDPRIEDRSRCQAGTQKRGQGGQVELQRESVGGEPERIDRECGSVRSQWERGAGRSSGHAGADSEYEAGDGGRGQGI
jgi:transposase